MKRDTGYINVLTDFGFKRTFMNKEILMAFLNAFLEPKEPRIVDIAYLTTEQLGASGQEKRVIDDPEFSRVTGIFAELKEKTSRMAIGAKRKIMIRAV